MDDDAELTFTEFAQLVGMPRDSANWQQQAPARLSAHISTLMSMHVSAHHTCLHTCLYAYRAHAHAYATKH